MRPLRILTTVWGAKYLDWLERGLFQSLKWPKNNAAIQHATYSVFTAGGDMQRVRELMNQIIPNDQLEVYDLVELAAKSKAIPVSENFQLLPFISCLHECLAAGEQLFIAPPDTIFAEGTIPNLLHFGRQAGTCVAVPHPRVDPTFLIAMNEKLNGPGSSKELVSLAWEHLHQSWSDAEEGKPTVNSYTGGVNWSKLHDGSIAVKHRLPTSYLLNFVPQDLTFFTHPHGGEAPRFGWFDWKWPGECLVPNADRPLQNRQRNVPSSNACFIVELTDPSINVPALRYANEFDPDGFCRQLPHNIHNSMNVTIFEKE